MTKSAVTGTRTEMAVDNARDPAEIQEFLEGLGSALTRGDGKAIARMWSVPALVLSDEGTHAVSAASEVEEFFGAAKAQYNAQGITDTHPDIVELNWLTSRIVLVEVRWPHLDTKGREVGEEYSTYALRKERDGGFRISAAIMHGAFSEPAEG
jgi:ketosteroid isomerase-like protein